MMSSIERNCAANIHSSPDIVKACCIYRTTSAQNKFAEPGSAQSFYLPLLAVGHRGVTLFHQCHLPCLHKVCCLHLVEIDPGR